MRELLKRLGLGFVCGVAGVHLLTIALSALRGGALVPVTAGLADLCGSELLAAGVQFLVSGAWGAAVCAGALFWTRERGSYWSNSLWNYLLDCAAFLMWAWVCLGLPRRWGTLWLLFALFTVLYLIGWLIRGISLRDTVDKINDLLAGPRGLQKGTSRWKAWESNPYWVLELVVFGLLPLAARPFDAADVPVLTALVLPGLVFPFTAAVSGFGLGARHGFSPYFVVMTLLTVVHGPRADFRVILALHLVYALLALLGNLAGAGWRRWRART